MPSENFEKVTHTNGQSWSATRVNALETRVDDAFASLESSVVSGDEVAAATTRQRIHKTDDGWTAGDPELVDIRDWDQAQPWRTALGAKITTGTDQLENIVTPWTSADEGKTVVIKPNSGTTYFTSTIESVDGGIATLADNCPFTVTAQRMMWGFDETAVLAEAFAECAAAGFMTRKLLLPGMHRASQIEIPTGLVVAGVGWGQNYPNTTDLQDTERVATCLKQLPGTNDDFVIFENAGGTDPYYAGPCSVENLVLLGPEPDVSGLTYTAGSGLALVDSAGNDLTPQDGFKLDHVHAIQFIDHGFSLPNCAVPGYLGHLRAFYNGRYGFNVVAKTATHGQSTHLFNCSADGNGEGGAYFEGFGSHHTIVLTNFKSEKGAFKTLPRVASGEQENAVIFHDCDRTPVVINGVSHIASATTHETEAPGPGIVITSDTTLVPRVTFAGVGVRVQAAQTTGASDAVTLRDSVNSVDIPRTVKEGTYAAGGSTTPAHVSHGGPFRRLVVGNTGQYTEPASAAEDVAVGVRGTAPAVQLYETDGTTDRKGFKWGLSGGNCQLRRLTDAGAYSTIISVQDGGSGSDAIVLGKSGDLVQLATGCRLDLGSQQRTATATSLSASVYDTLIGVTDTSAGRTITLPSIASVRAGRVITIVDESNAASGNNITIQRAGSDTFLGGATSIAISTNGGFRRVYSNGTVWVPLD